MVSHAELGDANRPAVEHQDMDCHPDSSDSDDVNKNYSNPMVIKQENEANNNTPNLSSLFMQNKASSLQNTPVSQMKMLSMNSNSPSLTNSPLSGRYDDDSAYLSSPISKSQHREDIIKKCLSSEKKIQWNTDQVDALLDYVEKHLDDFRGRMVHTRVWRQIGAQMTARFPHITPPHCYNKWKNLRRDVRLALSNPSRVVRNPQVLVRAARLAAQVYPTGPEAEPEFLRQLDTLPTSTTGLYEKRSRKASLSERKAIRNLNFQSPPTQVPHSDSKDRLNHNVNISMNYDSIRNNAHIPISPSSSPENNAITGELRQPANHLLSALATSLMQQRDISQQNTNPIFTNGSSPSRTNGPNLNSFVLNPNLLLYSANMLQNLQQQQQQQPSVMSQLLNQDDGPHSYPSGNDLTRDAMRHASGSNVDESHLPDENELRETFQYHSSTSPSQSTDSMPGIHPQQGTPWSPTGPASLPPQLQPQNLSGLSHQQIPPQPQPQTLPNSNLPQLPRLSIESLREIVQSFRNDESQRINTIDNLISMMHKMQSDSQRRLNALNQLMIFAQCKTPTC